MTRTLRAPLLALSLAMAMMFAFALPATAQPDRGGDALLGQIEDQLQDAVETGDVSTIPGVEDVVNGLTDELLEGATFEGVVDITGVVTNATGDALTFTGDIDGEILDAEGDWLADVADAFEFDAVPTQVGNGNGNDNGNGQGNGGCQILFLDLGPLFIDLLGLQVDLSQIELDITAVPGAGNLLGNLLCAVAGLLDGPGLLGNLGQSVERLLNQITGILDGLLG
jgi:hypothetical protein